MKVIFLDIDGVLNSSFWNESHQMEISDGTLIDQEKIELLAELVNKTDSRVGLTMEDVEAAMKLLNRG